MISMMMECIGGTWAGFYTDACMRPDCGNITSSGKALRMTMIMIFLHRMSD